MALTTTQALHGPVPAGHDPRSASGEGGVVGLPAGEIHVRLLYSAEHGDDTLHACQRLLPPDELQQAGRFHFAKDRARHLLTRALVRTSLSRYLPLAPEAWRFRTNAYGKPEPINEEWAGAGLAFNVSHTDGLIVWAIARQAALGVDAESVLERRAHLPVVRQMFADAEARVIERCAPDDRADAFFQHWTLKEAYAKARGLGLSLPLHKVAFDLSRAGEIRAAIDDDLQPPSAQWCFWQFRPRSPFLVAVCAARLAAGAQALRVLQVHPVRDDECTVPCAVRLSP